MHRPDQPQPVRVHPAALLGSEFVGDRPVGAQRVVAERVGGGDADHAEIVFSRQPPARRRDGARHRHFRVRFRERRNMQSRIHQRVPVGLFGNELAVEQAQDHIQRLRHPVALGVGIDPQHQRIRRQQPGSGAEHDPPLGHVIQLHDPVRHHQRLVIGQGDHAGAEADIAGPLRRDRDEQFRRGDDLEARGLGIAPGFFDLGLGDDKRR